MEQDVQIINGNSFALKGRFAGRNYVFPPDEPQRTPFPVARHIFGFGENRKDKAKTAAVLNRLGLLKLGGRYDEALAALFKVRFNSAKVVFESPLEERPQRGPQRDEDDDEDEESGSTPARPGSPGGDAEEAQASSADLALKERQRARMLKAREVMLANRLKRQAQEKE